MSGGRIRQLDLNLKLSDSTQADTISQRLEACLRDTLAHYRLPAGIPPQQISELTLNLPQLDANALEDSFRQALHLALDRYIGQLVALDDPASPSADGVDARDQPETPTAPDIAAAAVPLVAAPRHVPSTPASDPATASVAALRAAVEDTPATLAALPLQAIPQARLSVLRRLLSTLLTPLRALSQRPLSPPQLARQLNALHPQLATLQQQMQPLLEPASPAPLRGLLTPLLERLTQLACLPARLTPSDLVTAGVSGNGAARPTTVEARNPPPPATVLPGHSTDLPVLCDAIDALQRWLEQAQQTTAAERTPPEQGSAASPAQQADPHAAAPQHLAIQQCVAAAEPGTGQLRARDLQQLADCLGPETGGWPLPQVSNRLQRLLRLQTLEASLQAKLADWLGTQQHLPASLCSRRLQALRHALNQGRWPDPLQARARPQTQSPRPPAPHPASHTDANTTDAARQPPLPHPEHSQPPGKRAQPRALNAAQRLARQHPLRQQLPALIQQLLAWPQLPCALARRLHHCGQQLSSADAETLRSGDPLRWLARLLPQLQQLPDDEPIIDRHFQRYRRQLMAALRDAPLLPLPHVWYRALQPCLQQIEQARHRLQLAPALHTLLQLLDQAAGDAVSLARWLKPHRKTWHRMLQQLDPTLTPPRHPTAADVMAAEPATLAPETVPDSHRQQLCPAHHLETTNTGRSDLPTPADDSLDTTARVAATGTTTSVAGQADPVASRANLQHTLQTLLAQQRHAVTRSRPRRAGNRPTYRRPTGTADNSQRQHHQQQERQRLEQQQLQQQQLQQPLRQLQALRELLAAVISQQPARTLQALWQQQHSVLNSLSDYPSLQQQFSQLSDATPPPQQSSQPDAPSANSVMDAPASTNSADALAENALAENVVIENILTEKRPAKMNPPDANAERAEAGTGAPAATAPAPAQSPAAATTPLPPLVEALQQSLEALDRLSQQARQTPASQVVNDVDYLCHDAGLVILWPHLATLFSRQQLMENNHFLSEQHQRQAMALLMAALGQPIDYNDEEATALTAALLVGLPADTALCELPPLDDNQQQAVDTLLRAVIGQWRALRTMPPASLQNLFLQRQGYWERNDSQWKLTVADSGQDVLLQALPWPVSMIHLPWLDSVLSIDWKKGMDGVCLPQT